MWKNKPDFFIHLKISIDLNFGGSEKTRSTTESISKVAFKISRK